MRSPELNSEENPDEQERDIERVLRPQTFDDFTGQEHMMENIKVFVEAAKLREEPLDHVLLHGPPGLGKTTLSHIIANELGANIKITSGPVLEKPGDLAGLLTSLETGDVLFIDEIHRLSPVVEEYLYSAMEDYKIDIMLESGPNARSIQISINPFTLILIALVVVSAFTDIILAKPLERDYTTVIIILTMVFISGVLRFVQETRSGNAAEKLLEMIENTANIEMQPF